MAYKKKDADLPDFAQVERQEMLRGTGLGEEGIRRPQIGVVSSWGEVNPDPGSVHLDKIAFLTDGRLSGTNKGCAVAHISPESAVGGPLALVEDGDMVEIDIPNTRLDLLVDEDELARRRAAWTRPEPRMKKGYLSVYAKMADKTARGASLKYG